jgi:hypothetical protein
MIYMVIHNAKVHKAARTEKGHCSGQTLGPLSNIRQSGTSPATLQLATSAQAAMGGGNFGYIGCENGATTPPYTKQLFSKY